METYTCSGILRELEEKNPPRLLAFITYFIHQPNNGHLLNTQGWSHRGKRTNLKRVHDRDHPHSINLHDGRPPQIRWIILSALSDSGPSRSQYPTYRCRKARRSINCRPYWIWRTLKIRRWYNGWHVSLCLDSPAQVPEFV